MLHLDGSRALIGRNGAQSGQSSVVYDWHEPAKAAPQRTDYDALDRK